MDPRATKKERFILIRKPPAGMIQHRIPIGVPIRRADFEHILSLLPERMPKGWFVDASEVEDFVH